MALLEAEPRKSRRLLSPEVFRKGDSVFIGDGSETDNTRQYLDTIGEIPLLNKEQEDILAQKIEQGTASSLLLDFLGEKDQEFILRTDLSPKDAREFLEQHSLWTWIQPRIIFNKKDTVNKGSPKPLVDGFELRDQKIPFPQIDTASFKAIAREGKTAKNQMIEANLLLVVTMTKHYLGRGLDFDDLIEEGNIGLTRAVDKFDRRKGFKFSTYAVFWIRQAITRAIQNKGRTIRVSGNFLGKVAEARRFSERHMQEFGNEPTSKQISEALGLTLEEAELALRAQESLSLDFMEEEIEGSEKPLINFIEDTDESIEERTEKNLLIERMRKIILQNLRDPKKSRSTKALVLYFGLIDDRKLSYAEVGKLLGVSRPRASQLCEQALINLARQEEVLNLRRLGEV